MGLFDSIKAKLSGLLGSKGAEIDEGIDKAADIVDDKTGGKYSSQIDAGAEKVKDAIDSLDGKDDDIA